MKNIIFSISALLFSLTISAQIKNTGFEQPGTKDHNLPADWGVMNKKGYLINLDSTQKYTGNYSVKVFGTDSLSRDFQGISQSISFQTDKIKRVGLSVNIRTEDVKGYVAIWCQIWDSKQNKMVGFENIISQQPRITGSADWKKYTLNLTLGKEVDQLVFGSYLAGSGSAYFDDFSIADNKLSDTPPSDSVKKYIDVFKAVIKKNSIYRDSLDWLQIDSDIAELSKGMKRTEEARMLTGYILGKLRKAGDNHSFIQPKAIAQAYAKTNTVAAKVSSELIAGNIGYLSIPAFGSTDQKTMDDFANDIQQRIQMLETAQKIDGWIVDLRRNGGGNMYPMIAGLGPLTGEGILGYFVIGTGNHKKYIQWSYKSKKGKNGSMLGVTLNDPYKLKNTNAPVAVLIGPATGSSGEMTAMSFIGKPGTKLFGQPSSGHTTANQSFPLSDGSMLLLAVSLTADRNKKEFKGKIQPDEIIAMDNVSDKTLSAAKAWISEVGLLNNK